MSQPLDYNTEDVKNRPPMRRVNLVAIPVLVVLVVAFAFQGPAIANGWDLPRQVTNALYFLPQTSFPYHRLAWKNGVGSGFVFDVPTTWGLGAIQWVVIAAALTFFLRRLRLRFAVPIALAISLLIALEGPLLFEPFGMQVELDGP